MDTEKPRVWALKQWNRNGIVDGIGVPVGAVGDGVVEDGLGVGPGLTDGGAGGFPYVAGGDGGVDAGRRWCDAR